MQFISAYWLRTFNSLRVRNYRLYFFSQAISLAGNWVQLIAQAWLILQLTDSGALLGVVTGLQFLPSLLIGPWAGTVIDRVSKRMLLYVANALAASAALALGLLTITGTVEIWMVCALSLTAGLANAFDMPARQAFIADLVPEKRLQNAITLGAMEAQLARIVGPAIGALCIAFASLGGCFIINAVSYVVAIIGLMLMHKDPAWQRSQVARAKGQLWEGMQYIRHHQLPRLILGMMVLIGTLSCEFFITLPLLAKTTFHGGAEAYAAMTTALGIGAIIGGFYIAGQNIPRRLPTLAWRAVFFGVFMVSLAMAPTYQLALVALFFVGAAQIMLVSGANAMLMAHVDVHMRGRMSAWWVVIFMGSTPLGGPLMGWVAEQSSPGWAIAIGGLGALVSGTWILARKATRSVSVPDQTEQALVS